MLTRRCSERRYFLKADAQVVQLVEYLLALGCERYGVQAIAVVTMFSHIHMIIYDPHGHTWVYTSPKERTFVRAEIMIDRIDGDRVYLKEGPPLGTIVASVGVAEIYGTEFEVGH